MLERLFGMKYCSVRACSRLFCSVLVGQRTLRCEDNSGLCTDKVDNTISTRKMKVIVVKSTVGGDGLSRVMNDSVNAIVICMTSDVEVEVKDGKRTNGTSRSDVRDVVDDAKSVSGEEISREYIEGECYSAGTKEGKKEEEVEQWVDASFEEAGCEEREYNAHEEVMESFDSPVKIQNNWTSFQDVGLELCTLLRQSCYTRHSTSKREVKEMPPNYVGIMDAIAEVYSVRDNLEDVKGLFGKCFRWIASFSYPFGESGGCVDGVTAAVRYAERAKRIADSEISSCKNMGQDYVEMPEGGRYTLQLYNSKSQKWVDWLYLARSTCSKTCVGVFAATTIQSGIPLGICIGKEIYNFGVPGGGCPSWKKVRDVLKAKGKDDRYKMVVRNRKCEFVLIEAMSFPKCQLGSEDDIHKSEVEIYMGLHFAHPNLLRYKSKGNYSRRNGRLVNVAVEDDGLVVATTRLNVDDELFFNCDILAGREGKQENEIGKSRKRGRQ